MPTILLCSDLDRTLIPNGAAAESPSARPRLSRLASRSDVRMAYVSGRDADRVREAIEAYALPVPDAVIGDVGASIYHVHDSAWQPDRQWQEAIGRAWQGRRHDDITGLLSDLTRRGLTLQPPDAQNEFKISYFADPTLDLDRLQADIAAHLAEAQLPANIICSRDEADNRGLVDILPPGANKLLAIRFLMTAMGIDDAQTVFAGDSGNDLDVLTSGMQAVLVANAADDVRRRATERTARDGGSGRLYLAGGDFLGMNGNYAAGVLEGLAHFFPEAIDWIAES